MKPKPSMAHIYTLSDPRDGAIRYVGKSAHPAYRLTAHLRRARLENGNEPLLVWLRELRSANLCPVLTLIEAVSDEDWQERERFWIACLREQGHDLTNKAPGGQGVDLPRTPEWRARIAKRLQGHAVSPETRARLSEKTQQRLSDPQVREAHSQRLRGRKLSPEAIAKRTATQKGMTRSPESRARMSAAQKGRVVSEEARAKASAATRGRKRSPEAVAKTADALRGRSRPPEVVEKWAAKLRGRPLSDEHRAKLREAWKRRKERKEKG